MRRLLSHTRPLALALGVLGAALPACDKSGPLADLDASATWQTAAPSAASESPAPAVASSGPLDAARVMPERPVPTTSPTVRITMPEEVQLRAIQYMEAMQAPQPGDAYVDPAFAKQVADQLRGAGKTEVISSGRRIDILLDRGCEASLPREAVAHRTGASLTTLLSHGVLVVRCADRAVQCLQSTRDASDVLCTHK